MQSAILISPTIPKIFWRKLSDYEIAEYDKIFY